MRVRQGVHLDSRDLIKGFKPSTAACSALFRAQSTFLATARSKESSPHNRTGVSAIAHPALRPTGLRFWPGQSSLERGRLLEYRLKVAASSLAFNRNETYPKRHLHFNGYSGYGLTEYSFELDNERNPYWVVTLWKPTIHYGGPEVLGVVVVDPETGETQPYFLDEVGDGGIPAWIDLIYPESMTEDFITWNGVYINGWLNSWWGEEGVEIPTPFGGDSDDATLIYGADGRAKWFTGLTSSASTDQSLTSLMLVDSRTGKATRYRASGTNEAGVLDAVNSSVSNFTGYRGTTPIPYNFYGELTWVSPVVSDANIFQRLALVRGSNATAVLSENVRDGLRNYRTLLTSSGFSAAPTDQADRKRLTLRVDRFSQEASEQGTLYYIWSEETSDRVFVAHAGLSNELLVTLPGDQIDIHFIETGEGTVSVESFDNLEIKIRTSTEQESLNLRREDAEEAKERQD